MDFDMLDQLKEGMPGLPQVPSWMVEPGDLIQTRVGEWWLVLSAKPVVPLVNTRLENRKRINAGEEPKYPPVVLNVLNLTAAKQSLRMFDNLENLCIYANVWMRNGIALEIPTEKVLP